MASAQANDQTMDNEQQAQARREREDEKEAAEKAKRKVRQRKKRLLMLRGGVGMMQSLLSRQSSVGDPATRAMMFVDKLLLMLDVGLPFLNALQVRYDIDQETVALIESVTAQMKKEVQALMLWVQHPQYGPSHPHGEAIMKGCEEDWGTRTTSVTTQP